MGSFSCSALWIGALSYLLTIAQALSPSDGCVVLTGVNGFVAGYIAEVLLTKGYTVHGTVRPATLAQKSKLQHLYDMDEKLPGTLKLFAAELQRGHYDEAANGCSAILATAFPIPAGANDKNSTDPAFFQYQIDQGVEGSHAVMEVAQRLGLKVVLTSSVASCCPTKAKSHLKLGDKPYDESDWNDVSGHAFMNYHYAKMRAEKAAYDWNAAHEEVVPLSTILFPFAVGPPKHRATFSSFGLFNMVLSGELGPFYLPFEAMHLVDVRDVARGHVSALEHPDAKGRYIVSPHPKQSKWSFMETSELFKTKFPEYPVATVPLPGFIISLLPDKGFGDILTSCSNGFDGSKISKELGFEYEHLDVQKSLLELAEATIAAGMVEKGRGITATDLAVAMAAAVIFMIFLAVFCCRACCSGGRKTKKTE